MADTCHRCGAGCALIEREGGERSCRICGFVDYGGEDDVQIGRFLDSPAKAIDARALRLAAGWRAAWDFENESERWRRVMDGLPAVKDNRRGGRRRGLRRRRRG